MSLALSQVTVVDGRFGDCNIVDFHHFHENDKPNFPTDALDWRRIVIDTGPTQLLRGRGPTPKQIVAAVVHVLANLPFPGGVGAPKISEFQVTHLDNDHIGNAGAILQELYNEKYFQLPANVSDTFELIFPIIPPVEPPLDVVMGQPKPLPKVNPTDETVNEVDIAIDIRQWRLDLIASGLDPVLVLEIVNPPADIDYTTDPLNATITVRYKREDSVDNPSATPITLSLTVWINNAMTGVQIYDQSWETAVVNLPWVKFRIYNKQLASGAVQRAPTLPAPKSVTTDVASCTGLIKIYEDLKGIGYPVVLSRASDKIRKGWDTLNFRSGEEVHVSPTENQYRALRFHKFKQLCDEQEGRKKVQASGVENRASIVSLFVVDPTVVFSTPMKDSAGNDMKFSMMFTGDAYDRECDIQNTVLAWKNDGKVEDIILEVNVLKVPHHGSDATTDNLFYSRIRAEVYIVCGNHSAHGNPKLSSLQAITRGFDGRKRPSGLPFRIYFSDPDSNTDYTKNGKTKASATSRVIKYNDTSPTDANGSRYYELWKLAPRQTNARASLGTITFGVKNGHFVDEMTVGDWIQIKP